MASESQLFDGREILHEVSTPTIAEIESHRLPEPSRQIADAYEQFVDLRDRFVWRWMDLVFPHFRLSCVERDAEPKVRTDKVLLSIYITLVDDLLDNLDDIRTAEETMKLPFDEYTVDYDRPGIDRTYLRFTESVWQQFEERLERAPLVDQFRDVFYFDLRESLHAMRYQYLINQHPELASVTEAYGFAHSMVMFPYVDVDLMHSPIVGLDEIADIRELVWNAQKMARIGNWVTTWERELTQKDINSGVVIQAIAEGLVSFDTIDTIDDPEVTAELVESIRSADIESEFLDQWDEYHDAIKRTIDIPSVDVDDYLRGMAALMQYHLVTGPDERK